MLEVSLPVQLIVIMLLRAFDDFSDPSKIKFPEVEDLLINKLSSSVFDNTPLATIATPALKEPEYIPSTSVVPEVSFHSKVNPDGGEALTSEPIAL